MCNDGGTVWSIVSVAPLATSTDGVKAWRIMRACDWTLLNFCTIVPLSVLTPALPRVVFFVPRHAPRAGSGTCGEWHTEEECV
jgi:hypothetical protein